MSRERERGKNYKIGTISKAGLHEEEKSKMQLSQIYFTEKKKIFFI